MPIIFTQGSGNIFNFKTNQANTQKNKTKPITMTNTGAQATSQAMAMNPTTPTTINQGNNNNSGFQGFKGNSLFNFGNQILNQALIMTAAPQGPSIVIPTTPTNPTTPVNKPPDAVDDNKTTDKNTPITFNSLINDSDPDGDTITITTFTNPTNGSVIKNQDGTFTYTPKTDFTGTDKFTYTITDGKGGTDTATVTITIPTTPTTPPPVALTLADCADNNGTPADTTDDIFYYYFVVGDKSTKFAFLPNDPATFDKTKATSDQGYFFLIDNFSIDPNTKQPIGVTNPDYKLTYAKYLELLPNYQDDPTDV